MPPRPCLLPESSAGMHFWESLTFLLLLSFKFGEREAQRRWNSLLFVSCQVLILAKSRPPFCSLLRPGVLSALTFSEDSDSTGLSGPRQDVSPMSQVVPVSQAERTCCALGAELGPPARPPCFPQAPPSPLSLYDFLGAPVEGGGPCSSSVSLWSLLSAQQETRGA